MSAARGVGVGAIIMGLLLLAGLVAALAATTYVGDGDPESERFESYVRSGLLWTLVPLVAGTLVAGAGLMAHRAWARPLMLAMAPWHVLSGIGIPLAIAALWVLTSDDTDAVLD